MSLVTYQSLPVFIRSQVFSSRRTPYVDDHEGAINVWLLDYCNKQFRMMEMSFDLKQQNCRTVLQHPFYLIFIMFTIFYMKLHETNCGYQLLCSDSILIAV